MLALRVERGVLDVQPLDEEPDDDALLRSQLFGTPDRGKIEPGLLADLVAVAGDPLQDVKLLENVKFVMKDGLVFKKDGVMTPEKFFHPGPVKGWRRR